MSIKVDNDVAAPFEFLYRPSRYKVAWGGRGSGKSWHFARALLEGVPPYDRNRPANVATAADWIRQCRRAGLYDYGRVLYEKGGFSFEELGDAGLLEVEEDYQICVRRS